MRWVRAEFFSRRPHCGSTTVRKAADGKEMRWRPGGRPGSESVHSTTLATLAEQNRCQVGPTILFDRSPAGSPTPRFIHFRLGPSTDPPGCPSPTPAGPRNFLLHSDARLSLKPRLLPA
jgi:hypothetical protein